MPAVELLEQAPIFAGVERQELEHLARAAKEIDVPVGTELTHEGRYEGYVFVVISGKVGIERDGRTVDTIGAGDFFGEIAAIDGGPRTATARALEDSRLLTVSHEPFHKVLDASPKLRTAVMEAMERRLGRMDAEGAE
jgi:CRP/FNR family transcriptional regulator, cyclic AMP receptor protein